MARLSEALPNKRLKPADRVSEESSRLRLVGLCGSLGADPLDAAETGARKLRGE